MRDTSAPCPCHALVLVLTKAYMSTDACLSAYHAEVLVIVVDVSGACHISAELGSSNAGFSMSCSMLVNVWARPVV
eukprot:35953-Eustigmatos_ZCMA.PRE.1